MNSSTEMKYLPALVAIHGLQTSPGYSLADTAKLLATSEAAISRMFRLGKLTPFRTHRKRFAGALAVDLERYLADINQPKTEPASKLPPVATSKVAQATQTDVRPRPSIGNPSGANHSVIPGSVAPRRGNPPPSVLAAMVDEEF